VAARRLAPLSVMLWPGNTQPAFNISMRFCLRRRRFQACPAELQAAGHAKAKKLFNVVAPPLHEITATTLMMNGKYRCGDSRQLFHFTPSTS